jgi:hypothetical protein
MIIEKLAEQDLVSLGKEVGKVYKILYEVYLRTCCESCRDNYFVNSKNFHPERDLRDSWKCLEILQRWGYTEMTHDGILYTFSFRSNGNENSFSSDGIGAEQAICNLFVEVYGWIVNKYNKSNLLSQSEDKK